MLYTWPSHQKQASLALLRLLCASAELTYSSGSEFCVFVFSPPHSYWSILGVIPASIPLILQQLVFSDVPFLLSPRGRNMTAFLPHNLSLLLSHVMCTGLSLLTVVRFNWVWSFVLNTLQSLRWFINSIHLFGKCLLSAYYVWVRFSQHYKIYRVTIKYPNFFQVRVHQMPKSCFLNTISH